MAIGRKYQVELSEHQRVVFERFVIRGYEPDACWGWIGPVTSDGYPRVRHSKYREMSGQQASWLLEYPGAPLPPAVKTTCRSRLCTNPRHLRAARHRGQTPAFFGRVAFPEKGT